MELGDKKEAAKVDVLDDLVGERSATSSMKLPAARLDGVRGRCKKRETSYG